MQAQKTRHLFILLCLIFWTSVCCVNCLAETTPTDTSCQTDGFNDGINRDAEDFVTASLMIAEPVDVLYSSFGHSFFRMECPAFGMDYCFTYEGEDAEDQVFQFITGKLMMGMYAFPTEEYLREFVDKGRGLRQYPLNIPIEAKRELWRILDEKVAEGANLPYDYVKRSCTVTACLFILSVLNPKDLAPMEWGDYADHTIREMGDRNLENRQWSNWVLQTLTGTTIDRDVPPAKKQIIPTDLVEILSHTYYQGRPILTDYIQLTPISAPHKDPFLTPNKCAILLFLLAILSWFIPSHGIDYAFLTLQTIGGLVMTYLIFCSNLPNSEWSWLIIPLNPLPAILWYWRKYTNIIFAIINAIWLLAMVLYPHTLTHPANLIFVFAFSLILVKNSKYYKLIKINKV